MLLLQNIYLIAVLSTVNGAWSSWGPWQRCRKKGCKHNHRYRKCDKPKPQFDGKYCHGNDTQKSGKILMEKCLVLRKVSFKVINLVINFTNNV